MASQRILAVAAMAVAAAMATAQEARLDFSGRVKDADGKGIAGVVVNNGELFTVTDARGRWSLPTDTNRCKHVSISTPSAYKLPQERGLAKGFYVRVDDLARNQGKHDFTLERRRRVSDKFYYIAISDPQVRTAADMERWRTETVADLRTLTDSLSKEREVVANTLGDLVWDNMPLFDDYKASLEGLPMTTFQCIGNHDFDQRFQDLHNMPTGTPHYAEQYYHRHFGPTCYSYNIGKVHVVTLKNINYVGGKQYVEAVTGADLEWLRRDLGYVAKGSQVILNMHAAAWNAVERGGNVREAKELAAILKDYKVNVFAGHTHFFQNNVVTPSLYEHNIGAACGAWWRGWVNRCGAPCGYMLVGVDGDSLTWHYKSTRLGLDQQMRLYRPGAFPSQEGYVVANVWDWDAGCRVEYSIDGKPMGAMEQFEGYDPIHFSSLKKPSGATLTRHLFRAMPTEGAREMAVTFTNRFGETFRQTVSLTRTQVIAHRGHWRTEGAAQNSLASLRRAAEAGVYGSEFDVHMTFDSCLLVNHDADVNGLKIATTDCATLKAQTLANGEHPSTLDEYLEEGRKHPNLQLILEIKRQKSKEWEDALTRKVVETVNAKGLRHQVEYISFSGNVCRLVRQLDPKATIYYVNGDLAPGEVKALGFQGIDYNHEVLRQHPGWTGEAHALGLKVNAWTVDGKEDIQQLIDNGVDFITTNEPMLTKGLCK